MTETKLTQLVEPRWYDVLHDVYTRWDERAWRLADLVLLAEKETEFKQRYRMRLLMEHLASGRVVRPSLCAVGAQNVEVGR